MPRRKDATPMRRLAAAIALSAGFLAAPASADDAKPDPAHLRAAAEHFDAGVSALRKKDYERAAAQFEAADASVPGPQALKQAIKARNQAGQGSQAATLAALALDRYAGDAVIEKLARQTLEQLEPLLSKVKVSCAAPCELAVGDRAVPGVAVKRRVIYLDPGHATITVTFPGKDAPPPREVDAQAGKSLDLRFEPKKKAEPPPEPPAPTPAPDAAGPSKSEAPPEDAKAEPKPEDEGSPPPRKGLHPAFFGVGLATTAALGIATIWSGVDTQNNPGVSAVRAACQGQGTSCPLYQEGVSKQNRTNALLGSTLGFAGATVVVAIFTRWKGAPSAVAPVAPSALVVDRGAGLGAAGAF
jgi:hypothetical protein